MTARLSGIATIAQLNDRCRMGLDSDGRIVMIRTCLATFAETRIAELAVHRDLVLALRRYTFTPAEEAERKHGQLAYRGETVFFRIDYYDLDLVCGSEDPADPAITRRVLTMMLRDDL